LRQAVIETLEQRQMLTVTLAYSVLTINGTAGDDVIHVHLQDGNPNTLVVEDNVATAAYDPTDPTGGYYYYDLRTLSHSVYRIDINGLGGNDELVVDESYGIIRMSFTINSGGGGNDTIIGGSGNDVLNGGSGDDYICGGAGNNYIYGGAGNDTLYGTMNPDDAYLYGGDPSRAGTNSIYGGDGDDFIVGGPKNDRLYGAAGFDTIYGMGGNDYIDGGNDDDSLVGGNGDYGFGSNNGYCTIHGGNGNDYIEGDGNLHNYLFGDAGNDTIQAGNGGDQMFGGAGDDELDGGPGNDSLDSGSGNDLLTGGGGRNRFKISGYGSATVTDFDPAKDSYGNFVNLSTKVRK
jgi:Ca2+-binding RTX toxin-like protein